MISRIYRLVDTKRIEMVQREIAYSPSSAIIQVDCMAICPADQRYYLGKRPKEIQSRKLPMALIHEAFGTVLHDMSGQLPDGTRVVLIPLAPADDDSYVKGNYQEDSHFASSGQDGFMRDLIALPHARMVPIVGEASLIYVFSELLSVALGAIQAFESARVVPGEVFGVWGDGSMGFVMALALRLTYPKSCIYIFGKTARKMQKFSFANDTFFIDALPPGLRIDHAFECVGNTGSEAAIDQITGHILPQGCINLLGVSETTISLNTRRLLEKGLRCIGNSRSDANDIRNAVSLIHSSKVCQRYLHMLVSEVIDIRNENDIPKAFDQDVLNDFKTVLRWNL